MRTCSVDFAAFIFKSLRSHRLAKERTPQPGNAINLPAVRGGGNKEPSQQLLAVRKSTDSVPPRSALRSQREHYQVPQPISEPSILG
jgi:hypothetical protein